MLFLNKALLSICTTFLLSSTPASAFSLYPRTQSTNLGTGPWSVYAVPESGASGLPDTVFPELSYAGDRAYAGNAKFLTESEQLILSGGSGGFTFTSWHSSPTGWQNLYVYTSGAHPVGFTTPHSASIPAGATITGFSIDPKGKINFMYKGKFNGAFLACPVGGKKVFSEPFENGTYEIWHESTGTKDGCKGGIKVHLYVNSVCPKS